MALPPFPPKPPNNDDQEEKLLPPVGLGAIFQAKPSVDTTPEINVEDILKHFSAQRQEQAQRLFDPLYLLENVIGGAVRGAFNPEEAGSPTADPFTGALAGAYKAIPKTFEELAPYAPGGAAPDTEKSFGEPFKVGKELAPNSPLGAMAIGLGISFSAPGPDFIKLFKEDKAAEAAISAVRKVRHYSGGLVELNTPKGSFVIQDTPIRSRTTFQIPNKGLSLSLRNQHLRYLAPLDPEFAQVAITEAYRQVGKVGTDPAVLLQAGDPVPLALLPLSKYADSLRSPLKAMANNPKTADNLLQAVSDVDGKVRWIIYEADNPRKFVTYTLPKPYDNVNFPELDGIESIGLGFTPDADVPFKQIIGEILPTGVVSADFTRAKELERITTKDTFDVTVLDRLGKGIPLAGRAVPVQSEKGIMGAVALQLIRRATGELPNAMPIKTFNIPTAKPMFTASAVFDYPATTFENSFTFKTVGEFLTYLENNPAVLVKNRNNLKKSLAQIIASDVLAGRNDKLFLGDDVFVLDPINGTIRRTMHPRRISEGLQTLNPEKASNAIDFVLSPTTGSNDYELWKSLVERVGLTDSDVEDVIIEAKDTLTNDRLANNLVRTSKQLLSSSAGESVSTVLWKSFTRADILLGVTGDVAIPVSAAKTLPHVNPYIKINPELLPESFTKTGGKFAITDWSIIPDAPPVGPTETLVDQAAKYLSPEIAKSIRKELEAKISEGHLSPSYLMSPQELAPYLINQKGKFTAAVDVQNAAQGFKVFVEDKLQQALDDPEEFFKIYGFDHRIFPKQLQEVAAYYKDLSKRDPEEFARLSGIVATLQAGGPQRELADHLRNTGAIEALRKAGVTIEYTGLSRMVSGGGDIQMVRGAGLEWEEWSPEAIASMRVDPTKIDEMFTRYAHELPELNVRRITRGKLFRKMVASQIPSLADFESFTPEWVGIAVKDFGYTATAFKPDWNLSDWPDGDTLLEILVPKGTKGLVPGLLSQGFAPETEVILARNTPMRIVEVGEDPDSGIPKLTLEILSSVGAGVVVAEIGASFLPPNPSKEALANRPPLEEEQ